MRRVLMLASVSSMIDQFNMPNIALLRELGYEVDIACNFRQGNTSSSERVESYKKELEELGISYFQVDFSRNIFNIAKNIRAYIQLKEIVKERQHSFIHCHSPIGGVIGRLVAYFTKTKVIYTAHGFHFYTGAPFLNWIIYYPVERFLSKITDVLITLNKEDYVRAKKKLKAKELVYTPGIGIDLSKFMDSKIDRSGKRKELGLDDSDIMLLSVGELSKRKNHVVLIKALAKLNNKNVKLFICGKGQERARLSQISRDYGVEDRVTFLGYRTDVTEIYNAADIFAFPSFQEGLPVALMEACVAGLPVIASEIRGNTDLISHMNGGYLVKPTHTEGFSEGIEKMINQREIMKTFGEWNKEQIEKFELANVRKIMLKVYSNILDDEKNTTEKK